MTIDQIKKYQAYLGICIETADHLGLNQIKQALRQSMEMSIEYEQLVRQVQKFVGEVPVDVCVKSEVW